MLMLRCEQNVARRGSLLNFVQKNNKNQAKIEIQNLHIINKKTQKQSEKFFAECRFFYD